MSLLPDPPTGRSRAMLGMDTGLLQGSHPGSGLAELAAINSSAFDQHFFDFGEATMPVDQVGAAGLFQYEEGDTQTAFAKLAPTAARPSHIEGDILVDNQTFSLVTVAQFLSEQNPWIEVAFDLETITNLELSIGFTDPADASAGEVLADIDTPTFVAAVTDAAIMGIDTDETLKTLALVCRDNATTTAVTASPTTAPYGIPTLNTQVVYRLELRGQTAYAFVNGLLVATSAATAGPRAGVQLEGLILFANLDAANKKVRIDYIDIGQERVSNLLV